MGSNKGGRPGGKSERRAAGVPTLARIFEGTEMLDRMLGIAGASVDARGAIERFAAAIEGDRLPAEVIPGLFDKEPRFGTPEEAMRLYSNLFGVWDLLLAGNSVDEVARHTAPYEEGEEEEEAVDFGGGVELPPRGSIEGNEIPPEVVDGTWQLLEELPMRERTRRQDRYSNVQSELGEWARTVEGLTPPAQELLEYMCFELAEMFDHAFGDRFKGVRLRDLESADPDDADDRQPYAADYVTETLDDAEEDEEEPLIADERKTLELLARKALVAMTRATKD